MNRTLAGALCEKEGGGATPQKGVFVPGFVFCCRIAVVAGALLPGIAFAQQTTPATDAAQSSGTDTTIQQGPPLPPQPKSTVDPKGDEPIVTEKQFDSALPPLSDDINAPLEPMPQDAPVTPQAATKAPPSTTQSSPSDVDAAPVADSAPAVLPPVAEPPADLSQPLPTLESFNAEPVSQVADTGNGKSTEIGYDIAVDGLDDLGLEDEFNGFSALKAGKGKAANAAMLRARAREDEALAVKILKSRGYYDASASSVIETLPNDGGRLRAVITATPGKLYRFARIDVDAAQPVVPADLISRYLPLKVGDPIEAERVQGAEANLTLKLGENGYPFARLGTRDILLDDEAFTGDYTLPVDPRSRASFGAIRTRGRRQIMTTKHMMVLRRFKTGDLYDTRKVDDLRKALVATSLFQTVGVEPVETGNYATDGTEIVDLMVTQAKGKTRSIAATGGYSTGQGIRSEVTYTARNAFPEEGALILGAVGGTQEQSGSVTFRRSNAGERDRTLTLGLSGGRQDYDAFNAVTGTFFGRISRDSTPIWQKKLTYSYGYELTATNESVYNFNQFRRTRGTYFVAALPADVGIDTSDDLLNPTRGFRLKLGVSPETSVRGPIRPYVRMMLDGSYYYHAMDSLVIAGRVRVGSIVGIDRNDLPPSRRYYGGGGGSVRGYGYQRLGPFDPNGDPVGGRSVNEFALEARYRFGNFGIVPFIDAGNSYESSTPKFNDLRFGAGIGGRFYTNFGPLRVDVATPLNGRKGDSKIALYISIGQAF